MRAKEKCKIFTSSPSFLYKKIGLGRVTVTSESENVNLFVTGTSVICSFNSLQHIQAAFDINICHASEIFLHLKSSALGKC
jgi:hypothetical protein